MQIFLQCRWIVTAVQIYCGCINMYHLSGDSENHHILQNKAKYHGKTLFRAIWPGSFTLKLNALFDTRYLRRGGEVPWTARPWCLSSVSTRRYVPFCFPSIFLGNRRTSDIMDNINDAFIANIYCRKLGVICVYETKHEMNTNKNIHYYPIYTYLCIMQTKLLACQRFWFP